MSDTFTSVVINVYNGTGSVFTTDLSSYGKNTVTFGSSPANDIFINSPAVSEHHGYFQFTNMGWVVFDNHSKNGISVNGAKRNDVKLSDGMEIRIADESNKSIPVATMFVDVKEDSGNKAVLVEGENAGNATDAPKPKKKSKAPLIIVIILVVLFVLGILGFLLLGALGIAGVGLGFAFFGQNTDTTVNVPEETYVGTVEDTTSTPTEETTAPVVTEPPVELPDRVPSDTLCQQFVLAECNGSYTTLTLYEKEDGVWVEKLTADGRIGKNGITYSKREGDGCTPAGEFDLTFCCGLYDPGTKLYFREINSASVWVDDEDSYYYNTLQDANSYYKDWNSAEPMYNSYFSNGRHNYCINIAANGDGMSSQDAIPGCGSVITLCGKNDTLTETHGCVDISGSDMLDLLGYLDSNKNPVIIIY